MEDTMTARRDYTALTQAATDCYLMATLVQEVYVVPRTALDALKTALEELENV
jgi:hypothetical protein